MQLGGAPDQLSAGAFVADRHRLTVFEDLLRGAFDPSAVCSDRPSHSLSFTRGAPP
jgi:hypothetical protein